MLLDLLTVFFIVAGFALLWLNFRPKRPIVVTNADTQSTTSERPPSHSHPLFAEIERSLAEAKADQGPERAPRSDNVVQDRAEGKGTEVGGALRHVRTKIAA